MAPTEITIRFESSDHSSEHISAAPARLNVFEPAEWDNAPSSLFESYAPENATWEDSAAAFVVYIPDGYQDGEAFELEGQSRIVEQIGTHAYYSKSGLIKIWLYDEWLEGEFCGKLMSLETGQTHSSCASVRAPFVVDCWRASRLTRGWTRDVHFESHFCQQHLPR